MLVPVKARNGGKNGDNPLINGQHQIEYAGFFRPVVPTVAPAGPGIVLCLCVCTRTRHHRGRTTERTSETGMIRIKARGKESVNQMIKRFKKACEKEGLTKDIKRNSYYEKPSERRRRALRKSIKRTQKTK